MNTYPPGLYLYPNYFSVSCSKEAPCCLASQIPLQVKEVSEIDAHRFPCQRCMLAEIDDLTDSKTRWQHHDFKEGKLNRRTQHYGYRYDYTRRTALKDGALPFETLKTLVNLSVLFNQTLRPGTNLESQESNDKYKCNQAIINEYTAGQHINPHTDAKCFGPVIITTAVIGDTEYTMKGEGKEYRIPIKAGDLVILSGEARFNYTHATSKVNTSNYRRVSITLRTV